MCKRLISLICLICVLGLAVGVANAELVARWKLDEGSGTTAADATGNGHNGTLLNGPQWVDGHFGKALKFAGSPQKLDVPYSAKLNPQDEFTVSLWANVDPSGSGHRSPITSRDDAPTRGYIIYVEPGNTWQFWTGTGIVGDWDNTQGPAVQMDEWTYVTATYSNGAKKFYINGDLVRQGTRTIGPNTQQVLRIGGGATESTGNYFFVGMVDDVRIYSHALSDLQIQAVMANEPYPYTAAPRPLNGVMIDSTAIKLQWSPGELAASHDVYLSEDMDTVADATKDDPNVFLGSTTVSGMQVGSFGSPYPGGLVPGRTYYWRVDAVNEAKPDSPWKGEVWTFRIRPAVAWNPSPGDGIQYIAPDQDLAWQKGLASLFQTVYFGQSFDQVSSATTGGIPTADPTFDPGPLKLATTYYWRVDEFSLAAITHKGQVWSFTTMPEVPITDPNLLAWWKLDEGAGTNVVDWSGHGNHGTLVGDTHWVGGYDMGALAFDGSGDYAAFGTPPELYLPNNYTYCAWFKIGRNVHGNSGPQYLLCIGSRSDLVFGVEDNVGVNGDLSLHYYDTAPGFHAVGVGQTNWYADEWHMVAATKDATGHKIYLDGELRNSDTNTNRNNYNTTRIISLGARGWTGHQYYNGAIDDVRIYNKALTEDQIKQLVRGDPLLAWSPEPSHDAVVDIREVGSLGWSAGDTAASHDVYFGTDSSAVTAADKTSAHYMGNRAGTSFPLAGLVELGADYYWRIDEVEADQTVNAGQTWSFTVQPYLVVDDFESYTSDSPNRVFQTWIDGLGYSTDDFFPDGHPGNGTGALVGYDPLAGNIMETAIAHSGQSMPAEYNNVGPPYYSETERTWATPQNWTVNGVDTLVLHVRGSPANGAGQLYVALDDSSGNSAVVNHPDAAAVTSNTWLEWKIPLSSFSKVTATKIKKMYIGVGDRNSPKAGGAGSLYIDDIRVIKSE